MGIRQLFIFGLKEIALLITKKIVNGSCKGNTCFFLITTYFIGPENILSQIDIKLNS